MKRNSIFREELPGERKSVVNLLMTGYFVTISCLGYAAFFVYIELGQVERLLETMNIQTLTEEQFGLLKNRLTRTANQLQREMIGLAVIGSIVSIIGGLYTIGMVVRPLKKLVEFTESQGKTTLPEFKTNTEIKQLATAITELTQRLQASSKNQDEKEHQQTNC